MITLLLTLSLLVIMEVGEIPEDAVVRARVTDFHGLWNGAVFGTRDARITREEEKVSSGA